MPSDDYDINPTRMTVSEPGVMPQDREAESSVLSAMMISPDALQECLIELTRDDFYFAANQTIFLAVREMFNRNLPTTSRAPASWRRLAAVPICWALPTTRLPFSAGAATWRCSTATPRCVR